jgi:hypothetical protein
MTAWEHHHPPHDHPDFDAYLDTLTEDDLAAIQAASASPSSNIHNGGDTDSRDDFPEN